MMKDDKNLFLIKFTLCCTQGLLDTRFNPDFFLKKQPILQTKLLEILKYQQYTSEIMNSGVGILEILGPNVGSD